MNEVALRRRVAPEIAEQAHRGLVPREDVETRIGDVGGMRREAAERLGEWLAQGAGWS